MIPSASGTGCLKFRSLTPFNIALLTVLLVSPPSAEAQGMGGGSAILRPTRGAR